MHTCNKIQSWSYFLVFYCMANKPQMPWNTISEAPKDLRKRISFPCLLITYRPKREKWSRTVFLNFGYTLDHQRFHKFWWPSHTLDQLNQNLQRHQCFFKALRRSQQAIKVENNCSREENYVTYQALRQIHTYTSTLSHTIPTTFLFFQPIQGIR